MKKAKAKAKECRISLRRGSGGKQAKEYNKLYKLLKLYKHLFYAEANS